MPSTRLLIAALAHWIGLPAEDLAKRNLSLYLTSCAPASGAGSGTSLP